MRVLLLGAALLLAGCTTLAPVDGPARLRFDAPVAVSQEWPGAEPVLAMAPDGTLYLEGIGRAASPPATVEGNVNKVWRSTDDGATWQDVTPPGLGQERSNDGFVAVAGDGTVYAANVFSLTFQVYRSDDQGETWQRLDVPNLPALMHRHWIVPVGDTVHVTLEALPPSFATFLGGVPPPLAQTGNPNEGMWYLRSEDRGDTWTAPVQIDPVVNFAGQSAMVASADGQRLYVGRYEEPGRDPVEYTYDAGHFYLLASEDGGATWERREMFDLAGETSTAVPGLALAEDGRLSFVFTQPVGNASRLHLAGSADEGATWSTPREVPLPPGTHAMPWAVARGNGTLGVMWYAADEPGPARALDEPWFVDFAWVTDAAGEAPQVRAARVTPEPVHQGNICAKGPACRQGEDRRLLDYPWAVLGPDGRARLAFASTAWERPSAFAVYAREAGP